MKTPAERGPVGDWMFQTRHKRGYKSVAKLLPAFAKQTGVSIDYATYTGYEGGRPINNEKHRAAIEAMWGPIPEVGPVGSSDELVVAIRAQTDAITELVKRLDALAADPSPMAAVVAQTVVATLRSTGVLAGS